MKNESSVPTAAGITLRSVTKEFPMAGSTLKVLDRLELAVPPGEFLTIVGKSGSGKSTLLNMLTGIDRPTAGEIWADGVPIHSLGEGPLAKWRGRFVGVVFQFFQLMPSLTVLENIVLPMEFLGARPVREREPYARHLLERVGVADQAQKLPAALSGGQQQRVALARALANDPAVLAADEPTGNLDSRTAEEILALFMEMAGNGKTVIVVTHDRDIARHAGRRITLQDGRILSDEKSEKGAAHA